MSQGFCEIRRERWELPFLAMSHEVPGLRRAVRLHLARWGLAELTDTAQLCVSELTANVIRHVGVGTPTTLAVAMNGTHLRIEVHDPDSRALPTLLAPDPESEAGRGMALVDAMADRWGVQLRAAGKVTWCELRTGLTSPTAHAGGPHVARAEALLTLYAAATATTAPLALATATDTAVDVIADLLHWLCAHGCDPDEALDRAQAQFEGRCA